MMNLKHLFYFRNLAEREHFGQAAQSLDISQPSLSYAMSNLEKVVGVKLFKRKGRNVVLTNEGRLFRIFVEQTLGTLENGLDYLKTIRDKTIDGEMLLLLCDDKIGQETVDAAVQYLESRFYGTKVIPLSVPETDAKNFVDQGLADFELVQQHRDAVIKSSRETLPFKFERKHPAVRLSSNAHVRNQRGLLS